MSAIEDLASYIFARMPSETPEGERTTWDELTEQQRDIYRAHARNAALTFPDRHPEAAAETRTQVTDDVTDRARAALADWDRTVCVEIEVLTGPTAAADHYRNAPETVLDLVDEVERLRGALVRQRAEYDQAVADWGANDEAMLADNARLVAELKRLRGALEAIPSEWEADATYHRDTAAAIYKNCSDDIRDALRGAR